MFRVGLGYDSHRFAPADAKRPFVLGGVVFHDVPGLLGHSDADALTHAVIDALLGAIAQGDIGSHFPDTDARWKNADSLKLLDCVVAEVQAAHWQIVNVDATVLCEHVRLRPYVDKMRQCLAAHLGIAADAVSIKGKTNEGMDAVGHREGLSVHCICLVTRF